MGPRPRRAPRARPRAPGGPGRRGSARERLIAATSEVLRESGYRAASLDEILRRSGVAKSNLYYHFRGKLELAVATVESWLEGGLGELGTPLGDPERSGLERLRGFAEVFEAVSRAGPCGCVFGMLGAEDDLPDPLRRGVERAFEAIEAGLEEAAREGLRDGSIRGDVEPRAVARSLLAAVEGAGLMGRASRDPAWIGRACDSVLELAAPAAGDARAPAARG